MTSPPPSIEQIQRLVAAEFGVSVLELVSKRRSATVPRFVAMYIASRETPLSLPAIGRAFGGRDHTTVENALRRAEDMMGSRAMVLRVRWLVRKLREPGRLAS